MENAALSVKEILVANHVVLDIAVLNKVSLEAEDLFVFSNLYGTTFKAPVSEFTFNLSGADRLLDLDILW